MTDNLSPEARRKTMQAVKGKGTSLERRLFSTLAGMRLKGWRKNAGDITGKPDAVFVAERVAIFVYGCFWHGCPHCQRKLPKKNRAYWKRKIDRNIALAQSTKLSLTEAGWVVIRIWEHEVRDPAFMEEIRLSIRQALNRTSKLYESRKHRTGKSTHS